MKTILVPVEENDVLDSTLAVAFRLARLFDGYVEGFWIGPRPKRIVEPETFSAMVDDDTNLKHHEETQRKCQHIFTDRMEAYGLFRPAGEKIAPSYGWDPHWRVGDRYLAIRARLFDITVLGRPGSAESRPRYSTFEAALFESGRPILMAPPSLPGTLADNILIAWDASVETARTVAFAMPLLIRAAKITISSIPGHGSPEPSADEFARQLEHYRINSTVITLQQKGLSPGELILAAAAELGCDLLVKGAYARTRVRQFIFGSASRHIISQASLPVFTAH